RDGRHLRLTPARGDEFRHGCRPMDKIETSHQINRRPSGLLYAAAGLLVAVSAGAADDLKPPAGYRQWFHVNTMIVDEASPLFEALGGMHNVHVNPVGESALKTGGPYP